MNNAFSCTTFHAKHHQHGEKPLIVSLSTSPPPHENWQYHVTFAHKHQKSSAQIREQNNVNTFSFFNPFKEK